VIELGQHYPVSRLLNVVGLSSSTFYYQRKALALEDKYAEVKKIIRAIFDRHKGRYGYRRIWGALVGSGIKINHKTVQSLMAQLGIQSQVRPKKYRSYKGEISKAAPNELNRNFTAERPNKKWVTDVTEFAVAGKKLFFSPVMDLFNKEIVAFSLDTRPSFALVRSMLMSAIKKLKPGERPIVHSDQGWQYRMRTYQETLTECGLIQSMSRKGNCHDNAAMESFFGVVKTELFYPNEFKSVEHLQIELTAYIRYYNEQRIKMQLGGLSPVDYRTQHALP
jgi:transposase InsO family protein